MSNCATVTSTCSGHDGYPSRQALTGSPNVFVNGLPIHRVSDAWDTHCDSDCHDSILVVGSSSVFVNGLPVGRVGDAVECGSTVATGSLNVFVGG